MNTFLAVCQYMNYTHAADALHITQPAVSQHIRYLEKEYGVQLFIQEGKKIRLSEANGIKLRKSRITHSVVWDFFMEKY